MEATAVKNNKVSHSKVIGLEIPSYLQENLTTAIHGAFEVAVEIAVLEVTKLISVAAGDMFEKIRQENESLKKELKKAQSRIDSACSQAGSVGDQDGQLLRDEITSHPSTTAHSVYKCHQETNHSVDQTHLTEHLESETAGQYFTSQNVADSDPHEQRNNEANDTVEDNALHTSNDCKITGTDKELPHGYNVKAERMTHPCMGEGDHSPPSVSFPENDASRLVKVKVEEPEEMLIASDGLVDSFKEDAISQLQSEIMQEWTPGVSHFETEEQNDTLQAHSQVHGQPPNMNFSLDPALDPASTLNVNFSVDATDQASTQDSLNGYGSQVRRHQSQSKSGLHTCKLCGLNFFLPSLLRRHYGQCQRRLSQSACVPAVGGKRTKLQLYPPGCSPFRCSECNREFNRLENLKTHLRIHTGERPYKCSVCSTSFRHSGALTRHFRIHTGEKPYVCGLCGKSFRNCGGLKFHQRSHNKQN